MSRAFFLLVLSYFFTFACDAQPNVIVILADDLGYGDLGCYGNNAVKTPNIDRLSKNGIRFTQSYAAAPLCGPSRAALLTGKYNHRTGALSVESNKGLDRIALKEQTMADVFKKVGYKTCMIGKWHNGLFDMKHHPNSRGFDDFYGFLNGGMDYYKWILDHNGSPEYADGRYLTDVFSDYAVDFVNEKSNQPFFLYISYNSPHNPLQAPEQEVAKYNNTGRFNEAVSTLYAMISVMDQGIGRIINALEIAEQLDNTIILFTSDNGPWLGRDYFYTKNSGFRNLSIDRYNGPYSGMKQDVLEGGIRVPGILSWHGTITAVESNDIITGIDWLPTLAGLAGVQTNVNLNWDGTDYSKELLKSSKLADKDYYWQFNRYEPEMYSNACIRQGSWKLYWPYIPETRIKHKVDNVWYRGMYLYRHFETPIDLTPVKREISAPTLPKLYNIDNDPGEQKDLSSSNKEKVEQLKKAYTEWFQKVNVERLMLDDSWKGINIPKNKK